MRTPCNKCYANALNNLCYLQLSALCSVAIRRRFLQWEPYLITATYSSRSSFNCKVSTACLPQHSASPSVVLVTGMATIAYSKQNLETRHKTSVRSPRVYTVVLEAQACDTFGSSGWRSQTLIKVCVQKNSLTFLRLYIAM